MIFCETRLATAAMTLATISSSTNPLWPVTCRRHDDDVTGLLASKGTWASLRISSSDTGDISNGDLRPSGMVACHRSWTRKERQQT